MMPSDLPENINSVVKHILTALTKEVKLRIKGFGSTSLNGSDLQQGAEQNSCFYMQNIDSIIGKKMKA